MQTITFECEVITPMFLAGADGTTPELRAPSIKGALRFWWRAMNGHLPLAELQKRETEIFGGTSVDSRQRSKVIIRVECDKFESSYKMPVYNINTYDGKYRNINVLYYLAYGHTEYKKIDGRGQTVLSHPFIPPKTKFKIVLRMPNDIKDEIVQSFIAISQFSGIGSKSRNGFGCFGISQILGNENKRIEKPTISLKPFAERELASFTSFSKTTELYETVEDIDDWEGYDNWHTALGAIGASYQGSRESLDNPHHTYFNRLYIAQPIEVKGEKIPNFLGRHSKSLFMNVQKMKNGKFSAKVLFMPYKFIENHPDFEASNITTHQKNYDKQMKIFKDLFVDNDYFEKI